MKKHLRKCKDVDPEVKTQFIQQITTQKNSPSDSFIPPKSKKQRTLSNFVDHCTVSKKEELDILLARVVFAGGLSLSFIENPEFIIFCKKMRPSYDVPKRTIISNRLFNLKYEKIQTSIHKTVEKADFISIASDG